MPPTVRDEVIAFVFVDRSHMVVVVEMNASRIPQGQDGRVELRFGDEGETTQLAQRSRTTDGGQPHDAQKTPRHVLWAIIA